LSANKTTMFATAVSGWMQSVAATFNRYAIPRLCELNGMDTEFPPQLDPGDISLPDLAELGTYIANLTQAGFQIFPNEPIEKTLLQSAGLPIEGVELGREPLPPPAPFGGGDPNDPNADPNAPPKGIKPKPGGKTNVAGGARSSKTPNGSGSGGNKK